MSHLQCLSVVALLFAHQLNAQTGDGCYFTDCSVPGQVRINAIFDFNGNFVGGCNCACDPSKYDPSSANYCAPPNEVNYSPYNPIGDCSCVAKAPTPQPTVATVPTYAGNAPPPTYGAITPNLPTSGGIGMIPTYGGIRPNLPTYAAINPNPAVPAPTVPLGPAMPVTVVCDGSAPPTQPCECPLNTRGECNIICSGSTDACKDKIINCNNDGYACNINCMSETSCGGSSQINGPVGAPLEVVCSGEKSCEGNTQFNGASSTDVTFVCDGLTSCKGVTFNFGTAISLVECNGDPDSCIGAVFNLLPNARNMPGAAYMCEGQFCPEPGVDAPLPFSNVVGLGGCSGPGDCACQPNQLTPCTLSCRGTDACKDGVVSCNSDGLDCTVNCESETSCSGSTLIVGPANAKLTVNCKGNKACEGSVKVEASAATDVTIVCQGNEACKGSVELRFGTGVSSLSCLGSPDSCQGVLVELPLNAQMMAGAAYSCTGTNCPEIPLAFSNVGNPNVVTTSRPVIITTAAPQNGQTTVAPVNPGLPAVPAVPAVPATTANNVGNVGSPYCCVTSIPDFKPWAGRCWGLATQTECNNAANNRCVWDASKCHANPPINTIVDTPCRFYDVACTSDIECCSETCNSNGSCR